MGDSPTALVNDVWVQGDAAIIGYVGDANPAPQSPGGAYVFYRHGGGPEAWGRVQKLVITLDPDQLTERIMGRGFGQAHLRASHAAAAGGM